MKKLLIFLSFFIFSFSLVGCSSEYMGHIKVNNIAESNERVNLSLNWFTKEPIVSDGSSIIDILNEDRNEKQKVISPPAGSVFLSYQDIGTNKRDGFLNFTSTQAETEYLKTACYLYSINQDKEILDRAKEVGDRLLEKVFYVNLRNSSNKVALIPRLNKYNYDTGKWEELNKESYTEDILNTASSLIDLEKITQQHKYSQTIEDLLNTILTYQNQITLEQKNNLSGSLYEKSFSSEESIYTPSLNTYPLYFTLDVYETFTKASNYFNKKDYLFTRDKYLNWAFNELNEQESFNSKGLPFIGVNGLGKYINYYEENWDCENPIDSEKAWKMIYGLSIWKPNNAFKYSQILETSLGKSILGRWNIPEYISQKNTAVFKGDYIESTKVYLADYLKLLNKEEESNNISLDIIENQWTNGNDISKGAWSKGVITDIRISSIVIRYLSEKLN